MNKYVCGGFIFLGIVLLFFMEFNKYGIHSSRVYTYIGDYFHIPCESKHIALLGCTPHPTAYLKEHDNKNDLFQNIMLDDFLDREYLLDSFTKTFLLI